jgi:GNAT superfamily N-acetyltransferase
MPKSSYTIRTMTRAEVDLAVGWAAAEGWNPGLHDAGCFHAADPDGFLIGLLGDEPVATLSVVKYDAAFGFLGFYIVKPEYRGQGYGLQIWKAGLAYLAGCTIGLDGVASQQENYKKSGFALAYGNIRQQGTGSGDFQAQAGIVSLSTLSFDQICSYDKPFFPGPRAQFLECWINQPESTALGLVANGSLAGYGVVRACRSGYKIGPLFADTPEFAERLFVALKGYVPAGTPIFLDTPAVNQAALALAKRHNMAPVFETARMYAGASPDLPLNRLFGVTTFELG